MSMDIKDKNKYWMSFAFREAEKAFQSDEVPIGALIIKNQKIIGRGYNQCETLKDPTAHAEMIAITSAASTLNNWRLDDSILYVTKEPCLMCSGAIINSRIKLVIFGTYDKQFGYVSSYLDLVGGIKTPHQASFRGGVMEVECRRIIQEFFEIQRSKKKGVN